MIIICQQVAGEQRFEWNHTDWIGYVATIEVFVRYFPYLQIFPYLQWSVVCFVTIIICQQTAVLQQFEWNHTDWIGYVATIDGSVRHFEAIALCFLMVFICQQIAILQRFEWSCTDWIGYVATIEVFVRKFTPLWNKPHCVFWWLFDCQQIAVLQRFEWNCTDRIGYVKTVDSFVRWHNPAPFVIVCH